MPERSSLFRNLADSAPVLIWAAGSNGLCTFFNQPWLDFTGRPLAQELGEGWRENIHPKDRERCRRAYQIALDTQRAFRMDYRLRRHDGVYRWMLNTGAPRHENGEFAGFIGSMVDITEQRQAEEERERLLREAQAAELAKAESLTLLDTLLNTAPVGIAFFDTQLRYIRVNEALAAMNGRPVAMHLSQHPHDIVPDLAAVIERIGAQVIQTGQPCNEVKISGATASSGDQRHWLANFYPVRDPRSGMIIGLGMTRTDITETTRNEEAQRFLAEAGNVLASSLDYETTLSNVARLAVPTLADYCVIDLIDSQGHARRVATAHADPEQARSIEALRDFPPDFSQTFPPAIIAIETGRAQLASNISDEQLRQITRDEEHLALLRLLGPRSFIVAPLVARGQTYGVIWLVITASRRRHSLLDVALAEELAHRAAAAVDNAILYRAAQEAIEARDQFLSIASHELRTPVAITKSSAQLLLRAQEREQLTQERLQRFLRSIDMATNRLALLTNDLIDVSRIRTGQLPLRRQPVDLVEYARLLASRYRDGLAAGYNLIETLAPGPIMAHIDPDRIEQILVNLLDNGVKYTPSGGTVRLRLGTGDGGVLISVQDEGIGLPPGALKTIFEPFNRAPNAAVRQIPGLGLGLHICRDIAERHGGRIWAESAGEDQGTTLFLWLPTIAEDPTHRPNPATR